MVDGRNGVGRIGFSAILRMCRFFFSSISAIRPVAAHASSRLVLDLRGIEMNTASMDIRRGQPYDHSDGVKRRGLPGISANQPWGEDVGKGAQLASSRY